MKMFNWIKNLFNQKPKIGQDSIYANDEMAKDVIMRCFETGNIVIGNRDENGNVTITEHVIKKDGSDNE